jgi:hypothetical protein
MIVMVSLWAILHDRPRAWACQSCHWPESCCPKQLPHASTLSRRLSRRALQPEVEAIHARAVQQLGLKGRYVALDGKSLPVARHSKDPEARCGRGVGGMAKGYKLHAAIDANGVIATFQVTSLPVGEAKVAQKLLRRLPRTLTHVVADVNYDSQPLRRLAHKLKQCLYTPIRHNRVGKRQQPERLRMLRLLQRRVGQRLLLWRNSIERCFGLLGNLACGFKGLPNWCRRQRRVQLWLWGKVLLYHAFLLAKRQTA